MIDQSPRPVLQSARLTLSPCTPADAADFIALEHDPEVMRFLNGGRPVDPALRQEEADFLMPRGTEDEVWTARRSGDGTFAGWFCLWPEGDGRAEIGYRLRRDAWGQGLAVEGARAVIDWGFGVAQFDSIFGCTMTVNHASRRVMEKAGLTLARSYQMPWPAPFPGTEQGLVEYTISRRAWAASAKA